MPAGILDLFTEFRCLTNGVPVPGGNGLRGALAHYGLGGVAAAEKAWETANFASAENDHSVWKEIFGPQFRTEDAQ